MMNSGPVSSGGEVASDAQFWPMGAVTRRTGIGEHTLRAWERRFGFPRPVRLASGHRRYPTDQVQQLLLVAEALQCGYRAGDVVPLERAQLEELLRECGRVDEATGELAPEWMQRVLEAGRRFDREQLSAQLTHAAATMGLVPFLRERVDPIMVEVGKAWARGDLQVRHEHFISEVVEDVLRNLRGTLDQAGTGRPVVLANLPGEFHQLGLQIAGLVVAAAGRSQTILGGNTPIEDIVEAAHAVDAAAVGLSISVFAEPDETIRLVTAIRRQTPTRTRLWLGGAGARRLDDLPAGVQVFDTLEELERALRDLRD